MCAAIGDAMQTPAPIFHTVAEAAGSRETKRSEGETREVWRRRVERREEKNNAEETFAKWTARVRECDCACDCAVRLIDSRGSAPCVASHRTSSLEVRCCVVLCFLCGEVRCGALSLLIGAAVTRMHAGGRLRAPTARPRTGIFGVTVTNEAPRAQSQGTAVCVSVRDWTRDWSSEL